MELNDPVIALARAAIGRGDLLAAYDLVRTDGEPALTAERAYLAFRKRPGFTTQPGWRAPTTWTASRSAPA
jgi:hypothetical protein